jgi:hypothetical protein
MPLRDESIDDAPFRRILLHRDYDPGAQARINLRINTKVEDLRKFCRQDVLIPLILFWTFPIPGL